MSEPLAIEVAFAKPDRQVLIALALPAPATVADAIAASGITRHFAELAEGELNVGIFGQVATLGQLLKTGDRVEIYRPLVRDPKEARRQRAAK